VIDPRLLLLDAEDNVLVCISPIAAGDNLALDGAVVHATRSVGVGHKVARRLLRPGDTVIKYGAPIGSATRAIPPGAWVHSHNMQSDYIRSHSRETVSEGGEW
jgi:D-threo-aldose 1-dehydrogenase